jgi:hypothetical protein
VEILLQWRRAGEVSSANGVFEAGDYAAGGCAECGANDGREE